MRFNGYWAHAGGNIRRPMLFAEIETATGGWVGYDFLIDTGADVTVLSPDVLQNLDAPRQSRRGNSVELAALSQPLRFGQPSDSLLQMAPLPISGVRVPRSEYLEQSPIVFWASTYSVYSLSSRIPRTTSFA